MKTFIQTFLVGLFFTAGAQAYDRIDYSNLDCRYGKSQQSCGAYIEWESYSRQAFVTVQRRKRNGQLMAEKLFGCNDRMSKHVDWLVKGDSYTFRLYQGRCPGTQYPDRWELNHLLDRVNIDVPNRRRGNGRR